MRCGTLNGVDFDHCIRCGTPISAVAVGTSRIGGRVGGERLLATKVLLALTTLVFAGQLADWTSRKVLPLFMGGGPGVIVGATRFGALWLGPEALFEEPWRMLSAVFVHFSVMHFAMNMLSLLNLARLAEPAVGPARLMVTYVTTGIIGFLASIVWSTVVFPTRFPIPTAGASGAIFGIMGLILGVLLRLRDPRWKQFAIQAVFYSVLFGVVLRANNAAHIGGLVAGVGFGLLFAGERRGGEHLANLLAALGLVVSVASLVLALRSPQWRVLEEIMDDRGASVTKSPDPTTAVLRDPEAPPPT
ncbi:Rhomboid family protein [Chondromyces apiculatus DSM 436]|uniref:Rhomboid family protein n=1 Tax=Chondromyces apiculatus DSM 436 TaxID=1192034 RepID=A0A017SYL8_9BACT|nr:Rhomboid family protein [Chondromyces apiculatus DSM 436]